VPRKCNCGEESKLQLLTVVLLNGMQTAGSSRAGGLGYHMRKMLVLGLLFATLGACSSSRVDHIPLATAEIAIPDRTSLVEVGDVRVSPLDVIEIKVFGSTEMSGTYQVDPSGRIKMPLVGDVEAKGFSTFELSNILEARLGERFLQNPQVTVRISEVNGQQFTIEGAIGRPGMYPVRGPLTLLQALALSGGPAANANLQGIIIFRTIEGKRQAARFDLNKIRSGESVDPVVYGNDVIVIDGVEINKTIDDLMRGLPLVGMFVGLM
jgi:polysaccharide export outer membrane protein